MHQPVASPARSRSAAFSRASCARFVLAAAVLLSACAPGMSFSEPGGSVLGSLPDAATPKRVATASTVEAEAASTGSLSSLLIPVAGIRPEQLRDSYEEGRSGGRMHNAIDIMAPQGTPVLAAADGKVLKLHSGSKGGIALYHLDADGRTRYYYAHLDRYADGVTEGIRIRRGDVIGFVGDTGNAGLGNYHLHFSIARLADTHRWWDGDNLNPYPLLRGLLSSR